MSATTIDNTMAPAKRRVGAAELARLEGVSRGTVYNWVQRGIISPAYRIGNVCRFDLAEVREQLARFTASTTEG